jgi:hypothetical protein
VYLLVCVHVGVGGVVINQYVKDLGSPLQHLLPAWTAGDSMARTRLLRWLLSHAIVAEGSLQQTGSFLVVADWLLC